MFFTRMGLTKVLGAAVIGGAGMLTTGTAKADGFRFFLPLPPLPQFIFAPPTVIVQQPIVQAPVYAAPAPVYCPAPVAQPVEIIQAPVFAPAYGYDRNDWRRPEWRDRFNRHDDGFRAGFHR